jgi:hypothetical protein
VGSAGYRDITHHHLAAVGNMQTDCTGRYIHLKIIDVNMPAPITLDDTLEQIVRFGLQGS